MSDTMTERQGEKIIALLENILSELERNNRNIRTDLRELTQHVSGIESNTDPALGS